MLLSDNSVDKYVPHVCRLLRVDSDNHRAQQPYKLWNLSGIIIIRYTGQHAGTKRRNFFPLSSFSTWRPDCRQKPLTSSKEYTPTSPCPIRLAKGILLKRKILVAWFPVAFLTHIFTIVPLRLNRWLFCVHMFLLCSQPALYLCILT